VFSTRDDVLKISNQTRTRTVLLPDNMSAYYSHRRALVSHRYHIPTHCYDITVQLACLARVVTAEKFVYGPRLRAENFHNKVREFWQSLHASLTTVQNLSSSVHYLLVDQTRLRVFTVIDVAAVSAGRNETYGFGI